MLDLKAISENQQNPVELPLVVCFSDLTHYMKWASKTPALAVLQQMNAYLAFSTSLIQEHNGLFVKAIGDAGLFAFPATTIENTDNAVKAFVNLQTETNKWHDYNSMPSRVVIRANRGLVACGWIGASGQKRFDIYGDTVNQAAVLPAKSFSVSDDLIGYCTPTTRHLFTQQSNTCWELIKQSG